MPQPQKHDGECAMAWVDCYNCEEGLSSHDCGDDTCCCLNPESDLVWCDICRGAGGWYVCILCSPEVLKDEVYYSSEDVEDYPVDIVEYFDKPKCVVCGHGLAEHKGDPTTGAPCYVNKCGCPCFMEEFKSTVESDPEGIMSVRRKR